MLFVIIGLIFSYILLTKGGAKFVISSVLYKYVLKEDIAFEKLDGNLLVGVTFYGAEMHNIKSASEGTIVKIQQLFIKLNYFDIIRPIIQVDNARVFLPYSEPIVISGSFRNKKVNFNIYSKEVAIEDILSYFPKVNKARFALSGYLSEVDLYINGKVSSPEIKGRIITDKISYKQVSLQKSDIEVVINLRDIERSLKVFGNISLKTGSVQSRNTTVELEDSSVSFLGIPQNPSLNIRGNSDIDKVKIKLAIRGTVKKPVTNLSSDPSLSKEKIMFMLVSGKRLKGVEQSMDSGTLSPGLAKDFIGYFLFSNTDNSFAEFFGLSELSFDVDKNKTGIFAKKDLTDKMDIGYGVGNTIDQKEQSTVTQKVQGEYKVNSSVSVGVEKSIEEKNGSEDFADDTNKAKTDEKVYLKYNKSF
ncbi:MAG: translocation/assembly module TamB domain-containing protein [Candidatus Zapsychrus exili]|nr:translocation/assembly module TamB domain-containing protein [Candidatus Zapsychrus exili]